MSAYRRQLEIYNARMIELSNMRVGADTFAIQRISDEERLIRNSRQKLYRSRKVIQQ